MHASEASDPSRDAQVYAYTLAWLERAVIGLNLCPFAKSVHAKGLIHYRISHADTPAQLLDELRQELVALADMDAQQRDTTLLIAPGLLEDFFAFNAFLKQAERQLRKLRLDGVLQIASFHPDFQFADSASDDMGNFSNRAPYPTLHLLREQSIDKAVAAFAQADAIYDKNKRVLAALGRDGWDALGCAGRAWGRLGTARGMGVYS